MRVQVRLILNKQGVHYKVLDAGGTIQFHLSFTL
jgi:hypothetical protein